MSHRACASARRLATRQALGMAAMRLAIERGLDNVLVEDIAEAAGVSARTFNNYFASKYEAICALQQDRAVRIGDALRARPAGEPLWESVTQAVLSQFGPALQNGGPAGQPPREWIDGIRLVVTTPALHRRVPQGAGPGAVSSGRAIAERIGTSTGDRHVPADHGRRRLGRHPGRAWSAGCTPIRRYRSRR